jgi:hypothetical protein
MNGTIVLFQTDTRAAQFAVGFMLLRKDLSVAAN